MEMLHSSVFHNLVLDRDLKLFLLGRTLVIDVSSRCLIFDLMFCLSSHLHGECFKSHSDKITRFQLSFHRNSPFHVGNETKINIHFPLQEPFTSRRKGQCSPIAPWNNWAQNMAEKSNLEMNDFFVGQVVCYQIANVWTRWGILRLDGRAFGTSLERVTTLNCHKILSTESQPAHCSFLVQIFACKIGPILQHDFQPSRNASFLLDPTERGPT